jgi:hypothetical protein
LSAVPSNLTFQHILTTPPLPSALVHTSTHLLGNPLVGALGIISPKHFGHMRTNWSTFSTLLS